MGSGRASLEMGPSGIQPPGQNFEDIVSSTDSFSLPGHNSLWLYCRKDKISRVNTATRPSGFRHVPDEEAESNESPDKKPDQALESVRIWAALPGLKIG